MAADVFVNQVERVGDDATLAPPQAALVLNRSHFALEDHPTDIIRGPKGESIAGYSRVSLRGGGAGGGGVDLVSTYVAVTGPGSSVASWLFDPAAWPGFSSAKLSALLWCDIIAGVTPLWAASTAYTAGSPFSIVQNPTGAGGAPVAYVCTTPGTSSGSHGPTGVGSALQDQGGSACRWRSAQGQIALLTGNPVTQTLLAGSYATPAPGYTLGAAFAGAGASLLAVSLDLSAAFLALSTPTLITLSLSGDPDDVGGTAYTKTVCSRARISFS